MEKTQVLRVTVSRVYCNACFLFSA